MALSLDHEWVDEARRLREESRNDTLGVVRPESDKRDFRFEMIEEVLDALNYVQWSYEKFEITLSDYRLVRSHLLIALDNIPNAELIYHSRALSRRS